MNVQISSETSIWTDIVLMDANGAVVFKGALEMEPDWWVLRDTRKSVFGDTVKRWAGRREHIAVLGDAIKEIHKLTSLCANP
jgi:hypothetical protein